MSPTSDFKFSSSVFIVHFQKVNNKWEETFELLQRTMIFLLLTKHLLNYYNIGVWGHMAQIGLSLSL